MGKLVYITTFDREGTVQLPREVLDRLQWRPGEYIMVRVTGPERLEIQKVKKQAAGAGQVVKDDITCNKLSGNWEQAWS